MKRKSFFYGFILLLLAISSLPAFAASASSRTPVSNDQLILIGRLTAKALENNHLRKRAQNEMLSSLIFDEYFEQLDPGKFYFTLEDIAFFGKDRFRMLDKINSGDQQVIFDIYARYLQRLSAYREFVENELKKTIDFDTDETYLTDREKAAYCRNNTELQELWRRRLKNDLLYYRLMQRVMEERSNDPEVRAEMKKRWFKKSPAEKVRGRLHDAYNFASQADKMDILGTFLTAMAQVYGPHSYYSTPKQEEDFDIQFKLSLTGIGATLTSEDGYIKVVELVKGGPADKDGRLQPEDRIVAVTQEGQEAVDLIDMSVNNAVKHIRGPAGTKVTLSVLPAAKGAAAMPEDIVITRGKVELKENEAKGEITEVTASDGSKQRIGVITLNNFYMDFEGASRGLPNYRSCTRDVRAILERFKRENVHAVVMDMRSNSGGSLVEAISLSGLFITSGPVVQVVDSARRLDVQVDRDNSIVYNGPLLVLVSKFSASSAEIFTGAMQDYRRAVILGDSRTFGKGTVLSVMDLSRLLRFIRRKLDAGTLTHEVAMFYRVSGDSNQARGIIPDVILPSFTESMKVGESYSKNHLPWNRIAPLGLPASATSGYAAVLPDQIKKLADFVGQRFAREDHLQKFIREAERFKAIRDRDSVSLNEKQRLKEYYDEKAASEQMEAMLEGSDGKNKKKRDILLEESRLAAAEFAVMQKSGQQK